MAVLLKTKKVVGFLFLFGSLILFLGCRQIYSIEIEGKIGGWNKSETYSIEIFGIYGKCSTSGSHTFPLKVANGAFAIDLSLMHIMTGQVIVREGERIVSIFMVGIDDKDRAILSNNLSKQKFELVKTGRKEYQGQIQFDIVKDPEILRSLNLDSLMVDADFDKKNGLFRYDAGTIPDGTLVKVATAKPNPPGSDTILEYSFSDSKKEFPIETSNGFFSVCLENKYGNVFKVKLIEPEIINRTPIIKSKPPEVIFPD